MLQQSSFQMLGLGQYLPGTPVDSAEIDKQQGFQIGTVVRATGVQTRHYCQNETASEMAVKAIDDALEQAGLNVNDIDCLIAGSGTMEQAIPCNAAKILSHLATARPIPAFDINMTCLGSMCAIDMAIGLLQLGHYETICVVASDIASVGINWSQPKVAGIFGDGAGAILLKRTTQLGSRLLGRAFETYPAGVDHCQIAGGGTKHHPVTLGQATPADMIGLSQFSMQGKAIYQMAASIVPAFVSSLLAEQGLTTADIDWLVPHQASPSALRNMSKKLNIPREKMIDIVQTHGNQIAVSILSALHTLFNTKPVRRGDKILLLGTGAGLSVGGMLIEY